MGQTIPPGETGKVAKNTNTYDTDFIPYVEDKRMLDKAKPHFFLSNFQQYKLYFNMYDSYIDKGLLL